MSSRAYYVQRYVEIADGETESQIIPFGDYRSGGYFIPDPFTGTTMHLQVSLDGENFFPLCNDSGPVAATIGPGSAFPFPSGAAGFPFLRLSAGSSQQALRSIGVATKS